MAASMAAAAAYCCHGKSSSGTRGAVILACVRLTQASMSWLAYVSGWCGSSTYITENPRTPNHKP